MYFDTGVYLGCMGAAPTRLCPGSRDTALDRAVLAWLRGVLDPGGSDWVSGEEETLYYT
jgi:hypothetical protein